VPSDHDLRSAECINAVQYACKKRNFEVDQSGMVMASKGKEPDPIGGPYSTALDERLQRVLELVFASLHREGVNGGGALPMADKKFTKELEDSLETCGISLADVHAFNGVDLDESDDEEENNAAGPNGERRASSLNM